MIQIVTVISLNYQALAVFAMNALNLLVYIHVADIIVVYADIVFAIIVQNYVNVTFLLHLRVVIKVM